MTIAAGIVIAIRTQSVILIYDSIFLVVFKLSSGIALLIISKKHSAQKPKILSYIFERAENVSKLSEGAL
jgi:hypothetical protein